MLELSSHLLHMLLSVFAFSGQEFESPQQPLQHSIPGGVVIVDAGTSEQRPEVTFRGKPVMLLPPNDTRDHWAAVVGIPLSAKPGRHEVSINGKAHAFTIKSFPYKEQRLTVKRKHVNLSEEALTRVRSEKKHMLAAFRNFEPTQTWQPMAWPLKGPLTSPFGLQRYFNGQKRNPHSGLDIAASVGTPIVAPSDGRVTLTGNFYFNGNTVFMDHGEGLISMFCHMNSIEVKEGDVLTAGDRLGTVGATGRVTGPHLHWTVSLNDARINPLLILSPHPGVVSKALQDRTFKTEPGPSDP